MFNQNYYWRIVDGRIWSARAGAFVTPPEGAEIINLPGAVAGEAATAGDLKEVIVFYRGQGRDFPLGELAGPDELVKEFEEAVAARLDAFAKEKQYDNMDKARLASLTQEFKADGEFANQLYDTIWSAAFALEDQIRAGTMNIENALAGLPEMLWPEA